MFFFTLVPSCAENGSLELGQSTAHCVQKMGPGLSSLMVSIYRFQSTAQGDIRKISFSQRDGWRVGVGAFKGRSFSTTAAKGLGVGKRRAGSKKLCFHSREERCPSGQVYTWVQQLARQKGHARKARTPRRTTWVWCSSSKSVISGKCILEEEKEREKSHALWSCLVSIGVRRSFLLMPLLASYIKKAKKHGNDIRAMCFLPAHTVRCFFSVASVPLATGTLATGTLATGTLATGTPSHWHPGHWHPGHWDPQPLAPWPLAPWPVSGWSVSGSNISKCPRCDERLWFFSIGSILVGLREVHKSSSHIGSSFCPGSKCVDSTSSARSGMIVVLRNPTASLLLCFACRRRPTWRAREWGSWKCGRLLSSRQLLCGELMFPGFFRQRRELDVHWVKKVRE